MTKHIITQEEYEEVNGLIKANKLKRVDKRLQAIKLRYEGYKDSEIGEKLGYTRKSVSQLCAAFKKDGAQEYARHKYGGNNQSVSVEEEAKIIAEFRGRAEKGEIVTAGAIKKAFDEKRGKDTGRGYIYMLLARHKWRMVMPRGKHPKKATDEEIESSKKLT